MIAISCLSFGSTLCAVLLLQGFFGATLDAFSLGASFGCRAAV
jgi:hypothetical protein